jgi:hypothetical protein
MSAHARLQFVLLAAGLVAAFAAGASLAADPQPAAAADAVQYRPPGGDPAPRRVGGPVRGQAATGPWVAVLAPDHLALTLSEHPRLLWFLSAPTAARIEVALVDARQPNPLLETAVSGARAGIQVFDAGAFGVRLEPGVPYEWSVAVVTDPEQRSSDIVAGAAVMRAPASDALRNRLRGADADRQAAVLAAEGIWYDALATLSERVAERPDDRALHARRAALLEQAGLAEVAAFERGH